MAERLDRLLVRRGHFTTREKARRAVMAGLVEVEGRRIDKPGTAVPENARLEVKRAGDLYVSRGGHKLAAALEHFGLDPAGLVCLDVGASTGGFTDCLLQRGARRVYALDVGYGQLDFGLRRDRRVVVMERINVRHLAPGSIPEACALVTVDVSFISLVLVIPPLLACLSPAGHLLALVKPQFEVGRGQVGKGGVVRDEEARRQIVDRRAREMASLGLDLVGIVDSALAGAKGNRESFALLRRPK